MSELRGNVSDQPEDKPAESRISDAERIRELDAVGQTKAFDVSRPAYNPLDHIRPGDRDPVERPGDKPAVAPPPIADRPQLQSLADRIHAAREERYGAQDTSPGPTASADAGDDAKPSVSDAERLADAVEGDDAAGDRDAPASYDRELAERVPEWAGGKTHGLLAGPDGQPRWDEPQASGYQGPSAELPMPRRGMNGNILSHVEAHAAATMRLEGLDEATLYINRVPCPGSRGCDSMLPRMLPGDAKLTVYGPEEFTRVYRGLPEENTR